MCTAACEAQGTPSGAQEILQLRADIEAALARPRMPPCANVPLRRASLPLAELIEAGGKNPLLPHRRVVVVMFIYLRGFTARADASEPEDAISVLREYH